MHPLNTRLRLLLAASGLLCCADAAHAGGIPKPTIPKVGVYICTTEGTFSEAPNRPPRLETYSQQGGKGVTNVVKVKLRPESVKAARAALRHRHPGEVEFAHHYGRRYFWHAKGTVKHRRAQLLRIGQAVKAKAIHVWSTRNDNARYNLRFTLRKKLPRSAWVCLSLHKRLLMATSMGRSNTTQSAGFTLDRTLADVAAKRFKLRRGDRKDLTPGVDLACVPQKQVFKAGAPLTMRFSARITKGKRYRKHRAHISYGGAYRGSGRNNRFSFDVQDAQGRKLPDVGRKMNFGGLGGVATVAPQKPHHVDTDLRQWTGALKPGRYSVICSYSVELQSKSSLTWKEGHKRWSFVFQQKSNVEVVP